MPLFSLGVLAVSLKSKNKFEEHIFFKQLTIAGKSLNVNVYIFSPENVDERNNKIFAHYYDTTAKRWSRKWIAYPDLFFDRCRFYSAERYRIVSKFKKKNPQLSFISTPLANKWNLYRILSRKPGISSYLPSTTLYSKFDDLRRELLRRDLVFLKPVNGTGGRGILRIQRLLNGSYSVRGRGTDRTIIPEKKVNLLKLRQLIMARKPINRYIIQQGIDVRLGNGSVHDYRLLIQKNGSGKWEVTGCVGRVGASDSITSNLHGGGRAVPMMKLLRLWLGSNKKATAVADSIHDFGLQLGETLENNFGRLCELALDIAVDRSGRIWLLEVNTKPAREVFARIGDKTAYRKAIRRPLEYTRWLYQSKVGAL